MNALAGAILNATPSYPKPWVVLFLLPVPSIRCQWRSALLIYC